jgi:hypothetical protein
VVVGPAEVVFLVGGRQRLHVGVEGGEHLSGASSGAVWRGGGTD